MDERKKFLNEMADIFGFLGNETRRKVFLTRYAYEDADKQKPNTEIANSLKMDEWKFQQELGEIYKVLDKKGCPNLVFKKGRPSKEEGGNFINSFNWLWYNKFPSWQKNQGSASLSSETLAAQREIGGSATWRDEQHYNKFIARSDERSKMLKDLEEDRPQIFSIVGMGGMGKTAFCHKVVSDTYNARIFSRVAWVRARVCEYKADLFGKPDPRMEASLTTEDALRKIGEELRIPNWVILGQDQEKLEQEICKVLEASRCLIVIDGLEDAESPGKLAEKLQQVLGKSSVILTSREQVDANVIRYPMTKMSRPVSREFIREIAEERYSNPNENPLLELPDSKMEKILDVTEGMPLAMKLFVSQVDVLSPDDAIEGLQRVSTERQLYDYLFEASWQKIKKQQNKSSIVLLIYLAKIREPISISNLCRLKNLSEQEVRGGIETLRKLSLVECSTQGSGIRKVSLHSFTVRYVNETLKNKYGTISQ
ncbi:NB-ARC domain-containing protein [Aerosakkonema sp. BLCC-F183]|uniref:NB-ARC domain-containing protein n=1 Tax=Aerosakkonema sp. BLCC-F183 TaxID=3342834 RepID=UPI0035B78CF5